MLGTPTPSIFAFIYIYFIKPNFVLIFFILLYRLLTWLFRIIIFINTLIII